MKKFLLILGGMLILFLLAFCCSYTIYQKTDSFSDDSYAVQTITGKGRSGKRQEIQYDPISEEKRSEEKTPTYGTTTGERSLSEDASTQVAAESYRFLVNEEVLEQLREFNRRLCRQTFDRDFKSLEILENLE